MFVSSPEALIRVIDGGTMLIALRQPHECRFCHRMASFMVNRLGATRCVDCDHEFQKDPRAIADLLATLKEEISAEAWAKDLKADIQDYAFLDPINPVNHGPRVPAIYGRGWKRGPPLPEPVVEEAEPEEEPEEDAVRTCKQCFSDYYLQGMEGHDLDDGFCSDYCEKEYDRQIGGEDEDLEDPDQEG